MTVKLHLANDAETAAFGARLAKQLRAGQLVMLEGPLGVGKTALARAIIRSLPNPGGGIVPDEEVPSPTFTLVQTYEKALGPVAHADLYRLSDPDAVWELGLEEILCEGLCLVEWPDRLPSNFATHWWRVTLAMQGEGRSVIVEAAPALAEILQGFGNG